MTAPFRRMRAFDEVHPPELRDGMIPRSRVRFLGSELLAPADAHAFLASPARYGPDWLVCPSWLKAGMPPMFTDASCGARCAHLKF